MSKSRQFWALLKFQTTINPVIWFIPVALCAPLYFSNLFSADYHPGFSSILSVQNLFFVGFMGIFVLAPEVMQPRGTTAWNSGTDFLLTRAIDRSILYRSRVAFFYMLIAVISIAGLIVATRNPDLKVGEYSKVTQQECLKEVPGSTLVANSNGNTFPLISIPGGRVLVEEWHSWQFAITALLTQVAILFVYPLKRRLYLLYGATLMITFVPLIYMVTHRHDDEPRWTEHLFFTLAAHPIVFWTITVSAMILGQLWGERKFAKLQF